MIGNVPWVAFGSFSPLFFQYIGYTSSQVATLFVAQGVAGACGQYIGGALGDWAHSRDSLHGRIYVAQCSVALGVVWTHILLSSVPREADRYYSFMAVLVLKGLTCTWCPAGTLRPIVADISDEETRGFVLGYWLALEGCASAFGAPVVAYLSQDVFGYTPSKLTVQEMDASTRQVNAAALSQALSWTMVVPWCVCLCFFTLMHCTYPSDLKKMKEEKQQDEAEATELLAP